MKSILCCKGNKISKRLFVFYAFLSQNITSLAIFLTINIKVVEQNLSSKSTHKLRIWNILINENKDFFFF